MSDNDLHNQLKHLNDMNIETPQSAQKLRAQLLQQHASQQTPHRFPVTTFIYQIFRGNIMKEKLAHMNVALAIAGTLLTTGTVGAAAYYWFQTKTTVSEQQGIVKVDVSDCTKLSYYDAPKTYSYTEKYRILDPQYMTKDEVNRAELADCEQRAITALIEKSHPDMNEFPVTAPNEIPTNSRGLYFPVFRAGIVRAIDGNKITVGDLNSLRPSMPESVTLELADDVTVLNAGQQSPLSDLKPGDQIYFGYQNRSEPGKTIDRNSLDDLNWTSDPNDRSVIRGIGKMTMDYQLLDKLRSGVPDKIEVIESDPSRG